MDMNEDKVTDQIGNIRLFNGDCMELGYELDACEIDNEYYGNALRRLKEFEVEKRGRLF